MNNNEVTPTGFGIKKMRVLKRVSKQSSDYEILFCHINGPKAGLFKRETVASKSSKLGTLTDCMFEVHTKGVWKTMQRNQIAPFIEEFNKNRAKQNWAPMFIEEEND